MGRKANICSYVNIFIQMEQMFFNCDILVYNVGSNFFDEEVHYE